MDKTIKGVLQKGETTQGTSTTGKPYTRTHYNINGIKFSCIERSINDQISQQKLDGKNVEAVLFERQVGDKSFLNLKEIKELNEPVKETIDDSPVSIGHIMNLAADKTNSKFAEAEDSIYEEKYKENCERFIRLRAWLKEHIKKMNQN